MILLVRHGETAPNREGRLLGRSDPELTERGRRQSEALGRTLAGEAPRAVVASPLARCRATARAIAGACGLEIEVDDRLVEIDYGEWDGRSLRDIPPDLSRRWRLDASFAPPGGESLASVAERVSGWCEEWRDREQPVIAVSHVSPIKAAVAWALSADPVVAWRMFVDVASVTRIGLPDHGPVLLGFNERVVDDGSAP